MDLNVATKFNSVFPPASVTKVLTGTAVFALVEEGQLCLEDKVSASLPGLPPARKDITVLQCPSHTSGLPDLSDADGAVVADNQEEALAKLATMPMEFGQVRSRPTTRPAI